MQLHHKWWIFVLATSVTANHSWRLDVSMVILYRPIRTLKALQMQCWGVSRVLAVVTACVGAFLFRAGCILYLVWNDKRLRSKLEIEVHNLFRWSRFASPGESMFQHIVSAIHWAILGRCSNTCDDVMVVFLSISRWDHWSVLSETILAMRPALAILLDFRGGSVWGGRLSHIKSQSGDSWSLNSPRRNCNMSLFCSISADQFCRAGCAFGTLTSCASCILLSLALIFSAMSMPVGAMKHLLVRPAVAAPLDPNFAPMVLAKRTPLGTGLFRGGPSCKMYRNFGSFLPATRQGILRLMAVGAIVSHSDSASILRAFNHPKVLESCGSCQWRLGRHFGHSAEGQPCVLGVGIA